MLPSLRETLGGRLPPLRSEDPEFPVLPRPAPAAAAGPPQLPPPPPLQQQLHQQHGSNGTTAANDEEQGSGAPVVTLNGPKIYRYRAFTLTLTMSTEWRRKMRLAPEVIVKACLNAKTVREDRHSDVILHCSVCSPSRRVIDVSYSGNEFHGPEIFEDGVERYTFDLCRSLCSSSRDHIHSRLVLCIELPGCKPVYSTPFALLAREKQQQPTPQQCSGGGCNGGSVFSPPPRKSPKVATDTAATDLATTTGTSGPPFCVVQVFATASAEAFTKADASLAMLLGSSLQGVGSHRICFHSSAAQPPPLPQSSAPSPSALVASSAMPATTGTLAFAFTFCASADTAQRVCDLVPLFIANTPGTENPLNRDLAAAGIMVPLCVAYSW